MAEILYDMITESKSHHIQFTRFMDHELIRFYAHLSAMTITVAITWSLLLRLLNGVSFGTWFMFPQ